MNKKKTLIIVIASALVVIIGIVALVLALRGKNRNTVVDGTTTTVTVTESADVATDDVADGTLSDGSGGEESGEDKTDASNEDSDLKADAPTDAPTNESTDKVPEKETKPSDEKEENETSPVIDLPLEGTLAPTEAPTQPVTAPPTEAPTPAPTEPPTEAPTERPLTDKEKFINCGGTYVANSDGTVTVNYANVKGNVVIPNTIDGKKVVIEYADRWGDTSITSIYVDTEVIPDDAFSNFDGLVSVTLGPNVKTIGINTFIQCDNLESVTFMGEGVTDIPDGFVSGCYKLTSLTLPRSVKRVCLGSIENWQNYVSKAYPMLRRHDPEFDNYAKAVVPAFTFYTYSEPGEIEVYYDNWLSTAKCPETLEEMLEHERKYNYSIVYLD